MKISKTSIIYGLFYFFVLTLFFKNFILQYFSLALICSFFLISSKFKSKRPYFILLILIIIFWAFLSWIYNLFNDNADLYSYLFWLISYTPPFFLAIIVLAYNEVLNFYKIYDFYKKINFFQAGLLILSVIQYKRWVVGDPAVGTIGDANFVALHICIIIIYEVVSVGIRLKELSLSEKVKKLFEITFWFFILIIPESTANFGFLIIVLGVFIGYEFFGKRISFNRIIILTFLLITGGILFTQTFVYDRFLNTIESAQTSKQIDQNPYFNKLVLYRDLVVGRIYQKANIIVGSGPATFTSRASTIRIPEVRFNTPPFSVPYFKNEIFTKFAEQPIKVSYKSSYGNFGSPQTSVISIAVELGVIGFLLFVAFFIYILKSARKYKISGNHHTYYFIIYLSMFFILNLFFLNYWEYPIFTFTYILFVFLLLKSGFDKKNKVVLHTIN